MLCWGLVLRNNIDTKTDIVTDTGMTEDMCKKMLDPKNEVTVTVSENSDGSFTSDSKHSIAPEFNSVVTFKVIERRQLII